MNVVLVTCGSEGDVRPFLSLGRRLRKRDHAVTLLTHHAYAPLARRLGLSFDPIDDPGDHARFVADQPLLNTPRGTAEFLRRHSLPAVPRHFELLSRHVSQPSTVVVTRDLFDTAARLVHEVRGVPVVWMFAAPSQVTTWRLRVELFARVLAPELDRLRRDELRLAPTADWSSWLSYPRRSIGAWPAWFASPEPTWPGAVEPVGFVVTDDDGDVDPLPSEVAGLLGAGEPPILITAGTGAYLGAEFHAAGAEACRLLNRPGILVTQHRQQLPAVLPASVRAFRYLPFSALMPRMGAVVHHGGMGTLACALLSAVPQLVLPDGADRPDNAARLQRLGVAEVRSPPAWKPELVAESLQRLMKSEEVRSRCAALADRLRHDEAATRACALIEGLGS